MRRTAMMCAGLALAGLAPAERAQACGGFFCSSSPVQQAGETIVYGIEEDGTLTMAVQITYEGQDDDFAWILPVPVAPELSLGTDALFTELTRATQARFTTSAETEGSCRGYPACVDEHGDTAYTSGGCGLSAGAPVDYTPVYADAGPPRDAGIRAPADAASHDGGVTVYSQRSIGPYDTVVLGAATATEVVTWLREHDYDVPVGSPALLESYAALGHVFVALRLSTSPTTRTLRPIVLRMPTSEACLPLRLTAIATVADMPITAIFLGDARATPRNYSLTEVDFGNPALWLGTLSWSRALADAVDAAGGRAFVADYAGATPAISIELLPLLDLREETDPRVLVRVLDRRGYTEVDDLIAAFLEAPEGTTYAEYVTCLRETVGPCGAPTRFDAAGLVDAIDREITRPRAEAQALVERHPYLTRLSTAMSAEEMTVDPIFVLDEGLPDVSREHRAVVILECSSEYYFPQAPQALEVDGGPRVPIVRGIPADDEQYCRSMGLWLRGAPGSPMPRESGGCCSAIGARGGWRGWTLVVALGLVLARRRVRDARRR